MEVPFWQDMLKIKQPFKGFWSKYETWACLSYLLTRLKAWAIHRPARKRSFAPKEIEAIAKDIHQRAVARRIKHNELFEETENQIAVERDKEMDEGISLEESMKLVRKALNEGRPK